MGKTSRPSRFNIPGKIGWETIETQCFLVLIYTMLSVSAQEGITALPWPNKMMAGLFVSWTRHPSLTSPFIGPPWPEILLLTPHQTGHYIYRALLCPYLNPSMSPIHILPWSAALAWQFVNGTCIGGWLGGYGPRTFRDWQGDTAWTLMPRIEVGLMIWAVSLMINMYHDDELREIRRAAARQNRPDAAKVYLVPQNGLFRAVLYPHYFFEWLEWAGFWMVGGLSCVPARTFLINEVATMLPRAWQGKKWYVERFGKEKVGNRKAVIPLVI